MMIGITFMCVKAPANAEQINNSFAGWGRDALDTMQSEFWMPDRNIYADKITVGVKPDNSAFMWGCGIALTALDAAAKVQPVRYLPDLTAYLTGLKAYWLDSNGIPGFNVLPNQKNPDRYYDDNEWMVLALLEAYEDTHDQQILKWAEDTFKFVISGEDDKLGGGIYWHEQDKSSKNACSNAPAIVGALRLYQITRKKSYLDEANKLTLWINTNLQDKDGLYFDNIKLNGKVEKTKWSYNAALMIRANCLFYDITHRQSYLKEAKRIGLASVNIWIDANTGAFTKDGAVFAHLLTDAFLSLYSSSHDKQWLQIVQKGLTYLHDNCKDQNGNYPDNWAKPVTEPMSSVTLINQASAARAFFEAAIYSSN
jgi:uncharacterized protein YyaL (SSP411 family)